MKNILKISALALLATALTVSCAKEMNAPEEVAVKKITKTFTCTFAQPSTKVAVTNEGKTTWEVGDQIMIHGGSNGASRQLITLTADDISADGKKATITVVDMEPYDRTDKGYTSMFYAQYPGSLVPEGNLYYDSCFTTTNDFLMAACDVDDVFVFVNLTGVIAYQVNGDFDKVEFAGNNGETVAYTNYQARVYATADGVDVRYTTSGNVSPAPAPLKVVEANVVANGEAVNYICLPAGAIFTGGFNFKFYKGENVVKIAKTETAVEVTPGKILVLGDISDKLEDFVADVPSDHKSEITGATDLFSAKANSYVITAPGAYKFPAVKGESDEEVGYVYGAEIIWETYNNAEEVAANSVIAAVDFEDNWIYFKTPDALKPGNALIAAKNAAGKIIWSWHIWIPETAITTNTYNLFPQELMDRNLGALVAATAGSPAPVESFGLTYQWGRKDPFVSPLSATSGDVDNATVAGAEPAEAAGQISIGEAIANPTLLGHTDNGDWLSSPDNTLWENDTKTIYDPCPAGYKVPARDKTQPLMSETITTVEGWTVDTENHLILLGNPAAVFPISGYRDDYGPESYAKVLMRVAYWSSYASQDAKAYHLNWRTDKGTYTLDETAKARGAYVRCVKIDGWVAPEPPKEPTPFDSNVEFNAVKDNKAYTDIVVNVTYGDKTYEAVENVKLGTSSVIGFFNVTLPAGTTKLSLWALGWNNADGLLQVTVGDKTYPVTAAKNAGVSGNGPYNVTVTDADRHEVALDAALAADTEIKIETLADGKRAVIFGVVASDEPLPVVANIAIDGDMSDWDAIEGDSTPDKICKELKLYNDADNFYIYVSSAPGSRGSQLWGDEAGYYYFDFDLDNDVTTGVKEGSNEGFEAYMYLFLFGGSADAPIIKESPNGSGSSMTIDGIVAKGVITDELIEIELSVPRANLPEVTAGQTIRLLTWRSKDGSKNTVIYTVL